MTRTNTISNWEDVLSTKEAVAVKKYFTYGFEWKIEGIDVEPTADEFRAFCEARNLAHNDEVGKFFDHAAKYDIRTNPSNFYEYILRKEEEGMIRKFAKEFIADIKHDLKVFQSFTKKDWLEAVAIVIAIGIGILNTILLILAF